MNWNSKYFSLEEMTASATARRMNIDNKPSEKIVENLQQLVTHVLDPMREAWQQPIIVTSGYRCPRLNAAVGGAVKSQHCSGQAADIRTVSDRREDNMALLRCLLHAKLPFDQLIAEHVDSQGRPDWIHVSYSPRQRGVFLEVRGERQQL